VSVPLDSIRPNRFQPRKAKDDHKIQELADSIRKSGLIYPLLVRKIEESGVLRPIYELIAGERRFRALKLLGETEVPVVVKDISDRATLELALIENIQREDLNPIEQAEAFERLAREFGMTQEQIAQAVGKDRATIANCTRLLKLPQPVKEKILSGELSFGHGKALLALESAEQQIELAQMAVAEGLSVRQMEQLVQGKVMKPTRRTVGRKRDPHVAEVEERLMKALGTQVHIIHGKKRGWIRIAYYSLDDLDRLLARLLGH
jgi:ParB family chromosome partitioning protein